MSNLIPLPDDPPALTPVAISKTDLQPIRATDEPNLWRKFTDEIFRLFTRRSPELAERFAEAKLRKLEIENESQEADNQVKLLKAKQEFELVQAEIRRKELEAQGEHEKAQAEAERIRQEAGSKKAHAEIQKAAARTIKDKHQTLEEALKRLADITDQIRDAGGDVEIRRPRRRRKKS